MKEVRLLFYKAQFMSLTDWAIASWTLPFNPFTKPYSHCEIGFELDGKWQYFSSSIRDDGTRWKSESEILKHSERWDMFIKEYSEDDVEEMIKRLTSIMYRKYDILGIFGFLTVSGQVLNSKDRWYCSEACWYILTGQWFKRISPRRMSKKISQFFKRKEIQ